MASLRLSIFCSLLSVIALSGCSGPQQESARSFTEHQRGSVNGLIDKEMAAAYSRDNEDVFDACDYQYRPKILEIAKVLEAKRAEIEAFAKKATVVQNPSAVQSSYTSFGAYKFRNPLSTQPQKDEWLSESTSWSQLIAIYETIKGKPIDQSWVNFNIWFRGFASDDIDRLTISTFMGSDRLSTPLLEKALAETDVCFADTKCVKPSLSDESKKFLNTSALIRTYFKKFDDVSLRHSTKRKNLEYFRKTLFLKVKDRRFTVNPHARIEGNVLVIPMDFSAFASDEKKISQWLEDEWNIDSSYKIRIESIKKPAPGFLARVSNEVGGRAFVDKEKAVMQLYNFGRLRSIVHEFGHVIGLPDTYYTSRDPKKCDYKTETNPGDLMSDSGSGAVLPSHWEEIKKAYWKK